MTWNFWLLPLLLGAGITVCTTTLIWAVLGTKPSALGMKAWTLPTECSPSIHTTVQYFIPNLSWSTHEVLWNPSFYIYCNMYWDTGWPFYESHINCSGSYLCSPYLGVKTGGSRGQSHPCLHSKFEASVTLHNILPQKSKITLQKEYFSGFYFAYL